MTLVLRHPLEVLRRVHAGDPLTRMRERPGGRFVVRFGDGTQVADVAVATLLVSGDLMVRKLEADGSRAEYRLPPTLPEDPVARARPADPATSHQAAAGVQVSASQRYVRRLFQSFGDMTATELEQVARSEGVAYSASRLRSACAELERLGVLHRNGTRPTGHTTTTGVATHATVWSLQPSPP